MSLQDQLNQLQQKELNLEKAKTDLWLNAEYQRHQKEIEQIKNLKEEEIRNIKKQYDDAQRLLD